MWRAGRSKGHAEDTLDHDRVGESDAEHETSPAAGGLDRGGLLGHRVRVAGVGRHDGGHQLNALGLGGSEGQRAHRVVGEDVGHREGGEAFGLGLAGVVDDVGDFARGSGRALEDADSHAWDSCVSGCCGWMISGMCAVSPSVASRRLPRGGEG